ncbi:galactokinase [Portibacter lacus]|uniref:Galactokinase n=1 Tax=Portibacter lacus TaxID=1099794 RepID=A0AA37WGB6_9BACT|nr:galactokinase [Portibacter lacus]GLR19708.1 galactokinase [Portibacter lacus]
MNLEELESKFIAVFNQEPSIFRAPGRVNIIGEHTDYNQGLVLPFPIKQAIYFAATKRSDREIHIHALDIQKDTIINLDDVKLLEPWTRFFVGVLNVLAEDKFSFGGFNIMINGDIPFGAGISSSSALTCGFLYTIKSLYNLNYTKRDIVFLASRAENGTGVNGGKMDQFSICMGEENKAILLDCKDYSYTLIENNTQNASWFLFNSNVEHNLAETEYNDRRADCDEALQIINQKNPEITSLRDLDTESVNLYIDLISKKQFDRITHYVDENKRVLQMVKDLESNNLENAGILLYESHQSLAELYEVSCEELDFIVAKLKEEDYCYGARMMGGGFGGSVIALLKDTENDFKDLKKSYFDSFGLEMDIIPVVSKNGIEKIK